LLPDASEFRDAVPLTNCLFGPRLPHPFLLGLNRPFHACPLSARFSVEALHFVVCLAVFCHISPLYISFSSCERNKVLLSVICQVVASCHSLLKRGLLPLVDMIGPLLLVEAPLGGSCQPGFLYPTAFWGPIQPRYRVRLPVSRQLGAYALYPLPSVFCRLRATILGDSWPAFPPLMLCHMVSVAVCWGALAPFFSPKVYLSLLSFAISMQATAVSRYCDRCCQTFPRRLPLRSASWPWVRLTCLPMLH
jgi:hypothetical protein